MMVFWGASSVSLVFSRLLHLLVFSCYRPHTLPLSGQEWNSAPKTTRFWAGKDAVGCWVTEREDEVQDCMAIRERRWNTCCIQLAVFMHSKFITARSFEIPSYFYNAVVIFSICVSLAGCLFSWRKVLPVLGHVVCHSCSTSPHTHIPTHTHRIVGGRGETLWSGLRSLQLSWCTLTDLYSQEREKERWNWRM